MSDVDMIGGAPCRAERFFKNATVYVGELEYPYGRMLMSHMASPNIEALHKMADAIGLNRKWFQNEPRHPHYDVCKSMKKKAIALGAVEVNDRELIRRCYQISDHGK